MRPTFIEPVVEFAIGMLLVVIVVAVALVGTYRSEKSECLKWQKEADVYPGFFLTQNEKDQCDYHGIIISAPVQ